MYLIVSLIFIVRLILLVDQYALDLIINDQWVYLKGIIEQKSMMEGVFAEIGPHRNGLAWFFYKPILAFTGNNNRYLAFLVVGLNLLNFLLISIYLYRLKMRLFYADCLLPLMLFPLTQYAIYLLNPNISLHQLCFLLIISFVLILGISRQILQWLLLILLIPLIGITGNGILFVMALIFLPILLWKKKIINGWKALFISIYSILQLIIYFQLMNHRSQVCSGVPDLATILNFLQTLTLGGLGVAADSSWLNWFFFGGLMILLSVMLFRHKNSDKYGQLLAWTFIFYAIFFIGLALYGRWCYPMINNSSSRYIPHILLGFLGVYIFLRNSRSYRNVIAVVIGVSLLYNEYQFYNGDLKIIRKKHEKYEAWKECWLEYGSIEYCDDKAGITIYPQPEKIGLPQLLEDVYQKGRDK